MKKWIVRCLLAALSILSLQVTGHESQSADIHVMSPWSRAMPPVAKNGAVYLSLRNHGESADRLVGASTPVAEQVELHGHTMDGGVARMRQVESLELPPDTPVVLQPGGMHLMLLGLKASLVQGERFPLDLQFARAGRMQVEVEVLAPDAVGAGYPAHAHHGTHGTMAKAMEPQAKLGTAASGTGSKVFEFDIVKGKLGEEEPVLQVTQGDVVELRWTTDETLTLHMHGYDIELGVTPGERAVMRVDTTKTGRFPVLNHDANPPYVLLYMDVTAK